jgi:DNA polymerase-3 subunit alpha/error-prone DNA polymerase
MHMPQEYDVIAALRTDATGLIVVTDSSPLLQELAPAAVSLYAAITPRQVGSIPTARALGIPLAAIDDATFLSAQDYSIHRVLRAVATGTTIGMLEEADTESPEAYILNRSRYEELLCSWPEALAHTESIAAACAHIPLFESLVFPPYRLHGSSAHTELRKRVIFGAEKRYGELSDAILSRIEYELEIIGKKGFDTYFLVMDDIVALASRTCGRGSGAASIVSYALGITNVDPIAHNLYFERFLSPGRTDPPDLDVDFAWDERDAVLHAVIERFGSDHCARVANHNRFRFRSALRETARAHGIPDGDITQTEHLMATDGITAVTDPLWHTIMTLSAQIEGLPRGLSLHCGGLVITPEPICHYAPIEQSAEGYPLLTWEKEGTEAAGLVKIDLLGNRSLAVIRDALHMVNQSETIIDEYHWNPQEDPAVVQALSVGDSLGVFYIESPAMRQLQQKTGKGDFAHIVIHSSIIRPAANACITEYVRRLHGGHWEPLHPRLEEILRETYGILCYQEDVSKAAVALAGFSESQADTLRKIIAKKTKDERLSSYQQQFLSGCRAQGVSSQAAESVWEMMLSFEGYSFCKPHSASYAMVSFQSAYLRVHHPAAFLAAVLTNQGGYYRPQAYISEGRRMGLQIAGPDINRSEIAYTAEGNTIIVGLMAIAGLSTQAMHQIVRQRKRYGPFRSLEDCAGRLPLHRDDWTVLAAAGACDSLLPTAARSLQLRTVLTTQSVTDGQMDLFSVSQKQQKLPAATSRNRSQELMQEFEILGFLRDHHPLMLWAPLISRISRIAARDLEFFVGKRVVVIGWPVTRKTIWTKTGLPMDFVSCEDETALFETVLFPHTYARYRNLLFGQHPLVITGTVCREHMAISVEVHTITRLPQH